MARLPSDGDIGRLAVELWVVQPSVAFWDGSRGAGDASADEMLRGPRPSATGPLEPLLPRLLRKQTLQRQARPAKHVLPD